MLYELSEVILELPSAVLGLTLVLTDSFCEFSFFIVRIYIVVVSIRNANLFVF